MLDEARATALADAVLTAGWAVLPDAASPALCAALRAFAERLAAEGRFAPAGVGRGEGHQRRQDVRGDHVAWLDAGDRDPAWDDVCAGLDALRRAVNAHAFLGIVDWECHFARYPAGTFYRTHVDRFRDDDRRVLSFILYLNPEWRPDQDGGSLRLYRPDAAEDLMAEVWPREGTLVCFLSADIPHEVRETRRERMSLTGWMRRRPL